MVRHVIVWTLKDELNDSEKEKIKAGIKEGLEGLMGKVPGIVEIRLNCDKLASSSGAEVSLLIESSHDGRC